MFKNLESQSGTFVFSDVPRTLAGIRAMHCHLDCNRSPGRSFSKHVCTFSNTDKVASKTLTSSNMHPQAFWMLQSLTEPITKSCISQKHHEVPDLQANAIPGQGWV